MTQSRQETAMKSAKRNSTEGKLDQLAGRLMEMFGKVTGRNSSKAKGKTARARGAGRRSTAKVKKTAR
jgi:uncharacterized protein YjbJ (UPF0337 family)